MHEQETSELVRQVFGEILFTKFSWLFTALARFKRWWSHRETRPIDGIPDLHYHIHAYVFNATFDRDENRWKAGQFMNIKAGF